jgi:hypothetical protein
MWLWLAVFNLCSVWHVTPYLLHLQGSGLNDRPFFSSRRFVESLKTFTKQHTTKPKYKIFIHFCFIKFSDHNFMWISVSLHACNIFLQVHCLSPKGPDKLWSPSILLPDLFPRRWCGRIVRLVTHFNLVPRLRMRGAIHSLCLFHGWY